METGVRLRAAVVSDVATLHRWDEEPHVVASDPNDDWHWDVELARTPPWREQLIAELQGEPVGFVQLIDPLEEESHYWGDDVAPNLRALDIWIGEARYLGRGLGTEIMRLALARCFAPPEVAPPEAVFPLLCPVREADWIPGWDPLLVVSVSGVAEPDCVFTTSASPADAIWYVTRHEPAAGHVEMIKVTPAVTACRLTIRLRRTPQGCEADVTYMHTSLGPQGDEFVRAFTEASYVRAMQLWEARLNHYLVHGSALVDEPS